MSNLVILAGLPGCGKSTYAKTFFDLQKRIVSSDEIRKRLAGSLKEAHRDDIKPWDVFYGDIRDALQHQVDVVADATFLTPEHRQRARDVAAETGADTHLVLFMNFYESKYRNEDRPDDTRVPAEVMEGFVTLFNDTLVRLPQECYSSVTRISSYR